jgi:hypothetical protein
MAVMAVIWNTRESVNTLAIGESLFTKCGALPS